MLERRCEAVGRDPCDIKRSAQALVLLTDDRAEAERLRSPTTSPRAAIAGTTR